jgi:hypothetical protein
MIDWSLLNVDLIMEFIIKYYELIENAEMENYFFDILESKIGSYCNTNKCKIYIINKIYSVNNEYF